MKYILQLVAFLRMIRKLGTWQSFNLRFLAGRSDKVFPINVKGLQSPVFVRGNSSDPWILDQILVCNEYAGFIKNRPRTILDGGANIGLASLYWDSCFPGVEIVAVEPDPDNFEMLSKNTQHLPSVTRIKAGIWPKKTKLRVKYEGAEKYAISVVEDEINGTIDAYSIRSIMELKGWDFIDVVKLDVEGAEVPILAENCEEWIDHIGVLILELHQDIAPEAAKVLFKAFSAQDFHLAWRGENLILSRYAALEDVA